MKEWFTSNDVGLYSDKWKKLTNWFWFQNYKSDADGKNVDPDTESETPVHNS